MRDEYLLGSRTAAELYKAVKKLPIYDYHCHLSPREIWEDKSFTDIAEMWLSGDHYKWRLMRAAGIDEAFITGSAGWEEKFLAYAAAVENAAGNPLYHWTHMELSRYFGIDMPLSRSNASEVYKKANRIIKERELSPRRLIKLSNVKYIATTDDPADTLEYHGLLKADKDWNVTVAPSFRTDNLLLMQRLDYGAYIKRLSDAAAVDICDLGGFDKAIEKRLSFFVEAGCRFSDVGIPFFPSRIGSDAEAERALQKALAGEKTSCEEYSAFLGRMYVFLGGLYRKYGVVMQWHLAVQRNVNSRLYSDIGADCGGDCIGDEISGEKIARLLDAIDCNGGLPETIIYTLNPSMTDRLCSIAGSFRNVRVGAAWWFCDHKDGIKDTLRSVARVGHIAFFPGMLTDSRSFLSYARHDYFRRILCGLLAEWIDGGEFYGDAFSLAEALCCENTKKMIEGGHTV